MRPPLFIECKRPGCEQLREVNRPWQQRKGGYCSRRCASMVTQNVRKGTAKGVARSVQARKRAVLERVRHLAPLEAFKLGYRRGLQSKMTQMRKHYTWVRRTS